ncbi:MAG: succinate dehydrogenase/fumarate reductase flavoprotein subunit, partial [Clostridia bacterium]|nr:succinate dehydrogenase/fumarate reductase flavoprotein subunit [Clostridia bacterium]
MKRKRLIPLLSLLMCLLLMLSACGGTTTAAPTEAPAATEGTETVEQTGMIPGDYYGVGEGRNGAILLKVTLGSDSIDAIEVISESETQNTGSVPVEQYPALIVDNQTLDVD